MPFCMSIVSRSRNHRYRKTKPYKQPRQVSLIARVPGGTHSWCTRGLLDAVYYLADPPSASGRSI